MQRPQAVVSRSHATNHWDKSMLSTVEQRALKSFREYHVTTGQMLCFSGPELEKHKAALKILTEKDFLVEERFKGGYSLTRAGFKAMKACS
jgi:hypothetical protein